MATPRDLFILLIALFLGLFTACGSADRLPNGEPCEADVGCASRFCATGPWQPAVCAAPGADPDGDGLDNVAERAAGTNPAAKDTDGDGKDDRVEVGPHPAEPLDRDGDGKPDAIEHDGRDADGDCLADADDAANDTPASKEALAAAFCNLGVCAGHAPRARCLGIVGQVACEVVGVSTYQPNGEVRCDGLDNDCDGLTDEELAGKAGDVCGGSGVCIGAPKSRCVSGQWVCNLAGIAGYETVEQSCDGIDNDCDGQTDEAPICDDGISCTVDACVAGTGCQHVPAAKRCNDGNPCTVDLCELPDGCRSLAHIGTCDDGDPCTTGESCAKGVCAGGTATVCDDGNPCTLDPCAPQKGCVGVFLAEGTPCKPNDGCAQAGTCVLGVCKGHSVVNCDDGNPCTDDACITSEGGCLHSDNDSPCNDGSTCTKDDSCLGKRCVGVPLPSCCTADTDCLDSNPCSKDVCQGGACFNLGLSTAPCDDGNPCTLSERCKKGLCGGGLWQVCDDQDGCTLDVCEIKSGQASCSHVDLPDGANCDDGDVCNGFSACSQGSCVNGAALNCSDTNPCTLDSCHPQLGCKHIGHSGSCDDGNKCTLGDGCASGACVGKVLTCDDLNPCTIDTCQVDFGCRYLATAGPCDDGDLCTEQDRCGAGQCGGKAKDCDDGQPCTIDSCDATGSCDHSSQKTENTGCDDGDACTLSNICKQGVCSAGVSLDCDDGNSCTVDFCDKVSGVCKISLRTGPCVIPTGCTSDAVCVAGLCQGKAITACCALNGDCDDKNPCTLDECDKSVGTCSHQAVSGVSCSDGSLCTVGDTCSGGLCRGAAMLGCDDNKPCTLDYCLAESGCKHLVTVTGSCADGDPCNGEERCGVGGCLAGTPPDCDDGAFCTLDLCEAGKGCAHAYKKPGTSCDDGSSCTAADGCNGLGSCVGQATVGPGCCKIDGDCDDSYACTQDSCVTKLALCEHTPLPCAPGQACTAGWCETGTCKAASRCLTPTAFAESFEGQMAAGWTLTADAPAVSQGAAWQVLADSQATDGNQSLHCPLASGIYEANLPTMVLSAGAWRLRMAVRLDKDGSSCSQGALRILRAGQVISGGEVCASTTKAIDLDLPLVIATDGEVLRLTVRWEGVGAKPVAARGAWIDQVRIVAEASGPTCGCTP